MPLPLIKHKHWIVLAVCVLVVFTATIAWVKHRADVDSASDERKLVCSLEIIRTTTPADRKVLKVLFYGQSITAGGWHNRSRTLAPEVSRYNFRSAEPRIGGGGAS
jgi:hypothetical protein